MVLDHSFGDRTMQRHDVVWPGAEAAMEAIDQLRVRWLDRLAGLADDDLDRGDLTRWPYQDGRPFVHVAAWVNIELMRNAAEMSLLRRASPMFAGGRFQRS
jgi:DinB superfamily